MNFYSIIILFLSQLNFDLTLANDSNLLLTPLIRSGNIKNARKAARVTNLKNLTSVHSYSGFFTVNELYNSNLFFWFFPCEKNPETAPLLLWLQGGPGESSLFGLFTEHGPFQLDAALKLTMRPTSWTKTHSVIYMDSPVSAGFSYTENEAGFTKNMEDVGRDLYTALLQFFQLFPTYKDRHFYIGGESYGGKYVPAISHKIHIENNKLSSKSLGAKINFKGMVIGNGFIDSVLTLDYGKLLYNFGIIDSVERAHFRKEEEKTHQFIREKNFGEVYNVMDKLVFGTKPINNVTYFTQVTGFHSTYNLLRLNDPSNYLYFKDFVQLPHIRHAIHVGQRPFLYYDLGGPVFDHMENDIYTTVKPWLEELLNATEAYRILLYTGQLDFICGIQLAHNLVKKLKWKGAENFKVAKKQIRRHGNYSDVAGYANTFGPLTVLTMRNAGHRVPSDQPEWALDMINRFTAPAGVNFGAVN